MIETARDYLKQVIKDIDSDLRYDGLVFDNTDTADHNLDTTYKMVVGAMSINRIDSSMQSTFPVTINIYQVSNIDNQEQDFLDMYCKAIDITARAMNQTLIDQTDYLKSVEAELITPTPIIDNDNTIQFTLEFSVTVAYKYTI